MIVPHRFGAPDNRFLLLESQEGQALKGRTGLQRVDVRRR